MITLQAAKKFFLHKMLFALYWIISGGLIYLTIPPKNMPITDNFLICIIENNTPNFRSLKDYHAQALCQQPTTFYPNGFAFIFDKADDGWVLTTYSDSLSDPWQYHYRVDNQSQVIPLTITYGNFSRRFLAVVFGFFLAWLLSQLIFWGNNHAKRLLAKKQKQQSP